MKEILILDVLNKCDGKLVIGNENEVCNNFKTDTRKIEQGDIFVGIKGENFDGNLLYENALENGATTCILQGVNVDEDILKKYQDRNIVVVKDTIKAIGILAKYKRSLFDIPVVGITGSVGKTSTKDIVANVVAKKYNVLKTLGNLNSDIGLPLTVLGLKEEHEAMVIEMGMNHSGEIAYLSDILNPNISVITNVGSSHIGNLGSRENILKAKLEILEGMKKGGTFIYNNDNDMLNSHQKLFEEYATLNYGIENDSDFVASNIQIDNNSSKFDINIDGELYNVFVPVSGKHFVYNALCAIAVGLKLGVSMDDIISGIKDFSLTKNRMEVNKLENGLILVNDSYNASYDSMKAALEFLGSFKNKKKIAVLGDMLELGEFSDELHVNVGKTVYDNNIDVLVTVGKNSKEIVEGAVSKGINSNNVYNVDNNDEALNILYDIITKDSVVLIKASNSMKFVEIYNELIKKYN